MRFAILYRLSEIQFLMCNSVFDLNKMIYSAFREIKKCFYCLRLWIGKDILSKPMLLTNW